jgi:hypothetical protein
MDIAILAILARMVAPNPLLTAAYRGELEGVDPLRLKVSRLRALARRTNRDLHDVLWHVAEAVRKLREANKVCLCGGHYPNQASCPLAAADLTYGDPWSEIPIEIAEAAAISGIAFLVNILRDTMVQFELRGATSEQIAAFMRWYGPYWGLSRIYGDIARGIAGGYLE